MGGKPGGGATVVAGPEGKASPKLESRLLLDSVRLMERSDLKGSCFGLETGPWLQMLFDQKGLPSLLLTCSVLMLWLEEAGAEGGEKKETDRFSRLCPGTFS